MPRIVQFEGKQQTFPDDATDAEISAALGAIPAANAPNSPKAKIWAPMALAAAGKALPVVKDAAAELATNPNVPKAMATAGRVIGGAAPVVGGAMTYGPGGAAVGLAGASKGAWAGGRTGYFTGKLLQEVAAPAAKVLEAVAPYAQTLSTLSGAQGVGAIAQTLEPNRQDIGTLGVSVGQLRSDAEKAANPALINLAVEKVSDAIKRLIGLGMPQSEAVRQVMNASVKNKG